MMEQHINSITVVGCEERGILAAAYKTDGSVQFTSGLSVLIFQDLRFILNFTTRNILVNNFFPKDETELTKTSNDSLGYQILYGKADVAVGWLYHLKSRMRYSIPLITLGWEKYEAYFIQPSEKVSSKFIKPFHTDLIFCFVVTIIIISLIYTILNEGDLSWWTQSNRSQKCSLICQRIYDGCFLSYAVLCQKDFKPESGRTATGAKLILLIGIFLSLFVYFCYSASILSYFLDEFNLIRSFSDIFNYPFSIYVTPGMESLVFTSQKGSFTAFSNNGTSSPPVTFLKMEYSESLKRLFLGKHVHLGNHDVVGIEFSELRIPHHEVCQNISYVPMPGGNVPVGFHARRQFPHKNIFNTKLLQIKERGLVFRYRLAFKSESAIRCPKLVKRYDDDLGLMKMQLPFGILINGAIWSFIYLLAEVTAKSSCRLPKII